MKKQEITLYRTVKDYHAYAGMISLPKSFIGEEVKIIINRKLNIEEEKQLELYKLKEELYLIRKKRKEKKRKENEKNKRS